MADARNRIAAGNLEAVFLPGLGMLGASLRHRGEEILRRVDDLEQSAAKGSTAGIPLLYPWANRLSGPRYRAAGREVALDPRSPLLHLDEHGLPMHGIPWARLEWDVIRTEPDRITARLDWTRPDLLTIFPFPHTLRMEAALRPGGLTIRTTLEGSGESPVPVSFGFHPYVGLPGVPRAEWWLSLPAMRRLELGRDGIPTGEEKAFAGVDGPLGNAVFDDGFALLSGSGAFTLAGGGRRVTVELLSGYPFAQVFAPAGRDFVALEPMTAPTSALTTGLSLHLAGPGESFTATFRIRVEDAPPFLGVDDSHLLMTTNTDHVPARSRPGAKDKQRKGD
jgi:aldose 1-epimerase